MDMELTIGTTVTVARCTFSAIELHEHASELIFWLRGGEQTPDGKRKPFGFCCYQLLEDPKRVEPFQKCSYAKQATARLRFTFQEPNILAFSGNLALTAYGVGLDDLVVNDCQYALNRFPSAPVCMHCVVRNEFEMWRKLVQPIRNFSYDTCREILKYGWFLENYERCLKYAQICHAKFDEIGHTKYSLVSGNAPFIDFGDIGISYQYWKVYWLAVKSKYPELLVRISFKLHVKLIEAPRKSLEVTLTVDLIRRKYYVVKGSVPFYGDIWAMITYLFARVYSLQDLYPSEVTQLDYFGKKH